MALGFIMLPKMLFWSPQVRAAAGMVAPSTLVVVDNLALLDKMAVAPPLD